MTTVPQPTRRTLGDVQTEVSRYDQVSSLLVSLLILIGAAVAVMFVIWLTARFVFIPRSVPVTLVENVAGRGDRPEGFERDLEPPGMEEMPELAEPLLETSLEAVTDAASAIAASLDVLDTEADLTTEGAHGLGDSRPRGPLGEGDNIIPRWERWEVQWTSTSIDSYAQQLEYFGIELGAAGRSPTVDYARGLTQPRPASRSGSPGDESRLFMTWKGGTLVEYDRTLLRRAGIAADNRELMQFYPEQVENRLALIELQNGGGRSVKEFLKTVFGVRPVGRGFEFYVIEQRFRAAPG